MIDFTPTQFIGLIVSAFLILPFWIYIIVHIASSAWHSAQAESLNKFFTKEQKDGTKK